ncbi:hypothetical protein AVEN_206553-1 [Araneus ventricosus]|uniref:Uncharacterized protein n=1 Tax=Araneus ventricosus TaxID=182803 RepID=A0A4Y2SH96_ARAVE|nr:hypothetical protein AVEN_206553-1 [Araneus ventricosus]
MRCLCVKRVCPIRRRVNLTSNSRIGSTGLIINKGLYKMQLDVNLQIPIFLPSSMKMGNKRLLDITVSMSCDRKEEANLGIESTISLPEMPT